MKVYFLKVYFLKVYFLRVYYLKVYFLKVYFLKVYFPNAPIQILPIKVTLSSLKSSYFYELPFTVEDKTAGMQQHSNVPGGAFEIVALGTISFEIIANGTALDGCQQNPLSALFLTTDN